MKEYREKDEQCVECGGENPRISWKWWEKLILLFMLLHG